MMLKPQYNDTQAANAIMDAIKAVKATKPQDRSEKDRAYAVTVTELEKALAYFVCYVINPPPVEG